MKCLNYGCVALCLLTLSSRAAIWSPAPRLNDIAVTNELGQIIVLGTTGAYAAGYEKEKAFDNNNATFFDPAKVNAAGAWAGFELQSPRLVTRIRYLGRATFAVRMRGVLFQGANTPDFSDAVTLHTANPAADWTGTTWVDVTLADPAMLTPYKYLRFNAVGLESYGGNAAEVEFYGVAPLTVAPTAPAVSFADTVNWVGNFRWTTGANTMMVELQRKLFDEADYKTITTTILPEPGVVVNWRDLVNLVNSAAYRIRARNNVGDSDWQDFTVAAHNAAQGLWIGTAGTYGGGMTGDKVFDGNITTFFDSPAANANNAWSGLELDQGKMVSGVRYVPRVTFSSRMTGGTFEGANSADFNDASTLHTITDQPAEWSITEVGLAQPQGPFRYLRFRSPTGGYGNVAEVEFDLAPQAPKTPLNLRINSSDLTNDYAVLAWDYDTTTLISSGVVYRATAPGGPYVSVTPEGVFGRTYVDDDPGTVVGVTYYYRVALQYTDGSAIHEGAMGTYRTHRRAERLDREWSNLTQVKTGITILGMGSPYNGNQSVDVDKIFDNNFGTFYDGALRNPKPGLDFGAPCGVKLFRHAPRAVAQGIGRANGARLFGDSSVALTAGVEMGTLQDSVAGKLSDMHLATGAEYQYWYVTRVDTNEFFGNLAEAEFYGWPAANLANLLVAPLGAQLAVGAPLSINLEWEVCANATAYQIERAAHDSSVWTILATTAATNYVDSAVTAGTAYDYRVASVRGSELAYSESLTTIPYVLGSGTGLKGYYSLNYTKNYNPTETQALVRVDSQINFQWENTEAVLPSETNSVDNIGITWYGQLEIPLDGSYTFHINSDDGCALRIDGEYLINYWNFIATEHTGTIALTAGLHTIQLDYFNNNGGKRISLEWSGPIVREIIPSTQLIPQDLPSDDIGVWRGRTFNAPRLGQYRYNADIGAIEVYSYGMDLSGTSEGMHYLYQKINGSFIFEADVDGEFDPLCSSAKSMIMVRAALPIGSAFVAPAFMFDGQLGCKARLNTGAAIVDAATPAWTGGGTHPTRMRVKRLGSHFETWYRKTGGEWTALYSFDDIAGSFGREVYVGMAVCSPAGTTKKMLQKGIFKNITLRPAGGTVILIR